MSTLEQIADGIATALNTITTLRATADVPAVINPPTAFPSLAQQEFDQDFEGSRKAVWSVVILVSASDTRTAQSGLWAYLDKSGTSSVKLALEADSTLSGTVSDLTVTDSKAIQTYTIAGTDYMGAEVGFWTID